MKLTWPSASARSASATVAVAQDYPTKPVRLVVHIGAGSSMDIVARVLAQKMTESTATADRLRAFAHLEGKPLLASWMGGPEVQVGEELLNEARTQITTTPPSAEFNADVLAPGFNLAATIDELDRRALEDRRGR